MFILVLPLVCLAGFVLLSCATTPPPEEPEPAETTIEMPTPEEQDEDAMKAYEDILALADRSRRSEILPQLEQAHLDVIQRYPDSYLAHESYLMLIRSYLEDYHPPRWEEAEALYRRYFVRYEAPRMGRTIDFYMARFYYRDQEWDKLAAFIIPLMRRFAETGELPSSAHLFYYSEAMYNKKDFEEAEKGYLLIVESYPDSLEASIAKTRLGSIKDIRKRESQGER
jgi:tetratricopeptide (TPR) repeat protein